MKRVGFTLIELLVVIAIISILAAIIFPAAMRAKDAAYRSGDMSHLNDLRSALQLYRVDQGGYPPELFGYVAPYSGTPISADQTQDYLFPKRVSSLSTFQPGYDHASLTAVVGGATSTGACSTPNTSCVYWPGNVTAGASCGVQAFGYNSVYNSNPALVTANMNQPVSATNPVLPFYAADGYDVAPVLEPDGTTRYEIHYALFWTGWGLGIQDTAGAWCTNNNTAPTNASSPGTGIPGSASDLPNQLGYNNPPDTTVITWDTFFRDYTNNAPTTGEKRDVVLFIGGNAKMYDSAAVAQRTWNVSP